MDRERKLFFFLLFVCPSDMTVGLLSASLFGGLVIHMFVHMWGVTESRIANQCSTLFDLINVHVYSFLFHFAICIFCCYDYAFLQSCGNVFHREYYLCWKSMLFLETRSTKIKGSSQNQDKDR